MFPARHPYNKNICSTFGKKHTFFDFFYYTRQKQKHMSARCRPRHTKNVIQVLNFCFAPPTSHRLSIEMNQKQAQRRAAADRSRHKSHGRIQYQGAYFPT